MPHDSDQFATKKGIERLLEAIAAYVKKWERSDLAKKDALLALQNKVLFESLSPEGHARVLSDWEELGLAKGKPVC